MGWLPAGVISTGNTTLVPEERSQKEISGIEEFIKDVLNGTKGLRRRSRWVGGASRETIASTRGRMDVPGGVSSPQV